MMTKNLTIVVCVKRGLLPKETWNITCYHTPGKDHMFAVTATSHTKPVGTEIDTSGFILAKGLICAKPVERHSGGGGT